jgi:hypothetical protein
MTALLKVLITSSAKNTHFEYSRHLLVDGFIRDEALEPSCSAHPRLSRSSKISSEFHATERTLSTGIDSRHGLGGKTDRSRGVALSRCVEQCRQGTGLTVVVVCLSVVPADCAGAGRQAGRVYRESIDRTAIALPLLCSLHLIVLFICSPN